MTLYPTLENTYQRDLTSSSLDFKIFLCVNDYITLLPTVEMSVNKLDNECGSCNTVHLPLISNLLH